MLAVHTATTSSKSIAQRLWVALRFFLFGVIGFFVMFEFWLNFESRVFYGNPHTLSPLISFPLLLGGAVMMLYGVGEWGRWTYLLVFLSIPASMRLLALPYFGRDKANGRWL